MISKVLKGWFTGKDNESFEMGRFLWFVGGIAMMVYQAWALYKGQNWDPIAFGGGFAALLAAGGFGIRMKDNAEATTVKVDNVSGDINAEKVSVG